MIPIAMPRDKCHHCGQPAMSVELHMCRDHYRQAFEIAIPEPPKPSKRGFLTEYNARKGK